MLAAWIGAAVFAVMGLAVVLTVPTSPEAPRPPLGAFVFPLLIYAWIGWSLVWTAPPILGWFHRKAVAPIAASVRLAQPGCLLSAIFGLLTVALLWWLVFFPAIVLAMVYGLFGGGVRELRRCQRAWAARREPAGETPAA